MLRELVTPAWISEQMRKRVWSDTRLANKIGVHPRLVQYWRAGKRHPNVENVEALLKVFGYKIEVKHE